MNLLEKAGFELVVPMLDEDVETWAANISDEERNDAIHRDPLIVFCQILAEQLMTAEPLLVLALAKMLGEDRRYCPVCLFNTLAKNPNCTTEGCKCQNARSEEWFAEQIIPMLAERIDQIYTAWLNTPKEERNGEEDNKTAHEEGCDCEACSREEE